MSRRLRNVLSETLVPQSLALVYNSYDVVGDITIIRLTEASEECCLEIADAVTKVYFSPRLSHERTRIAEQAETVKLC